MRTKFTCMDCRFAEVDEDEYPCDKCKLHEGYYTEWKPVIVGGKLDE